MKTGSAGVTPPLIRRYDRSDLEESISALFLRKKLPGIAEVQYCTGFCRTWAVTRLASRSGIQYQVHV